MKHEDLKDNSVIDSERASDAHKNESVIASKKEEETILIVDGIRRHGRFKARPYDVDPLDESSLLPRALRRFRLKEWVGFTLLHPELSSSMILQEAHYLASSEIYVRDKHGMVEHSRNVRGGSLKLPHELFPSAPAIDANGYWIGTTGQSNQMDVIGFEFLSTQRQSRLRSRWTLSLMEQKLRPHYP